MHARIALGLVTLVTLMVPIAARAEIRTDIVVIIGVKLSSTSAAAAHKRSAELAKHKVALFEDPSLTWEPRPPITTYAGRVLVRQRTSRGTQAVTLPVPDAALVESVRKDLEALGLPDDVQLVAVMEASGGK